MDDNPFHGSGVLTYPVPTLSIGTKDGWVADDQRVAMVTDS